MPTETACVTDVRLEIGEGPVWSVAERCLYFVDIAQRKLLRVDPQSGDLATRGLESLAAAVAPCAGGGLLLAGTNGFSIFDFQTGSRKSLATAGGEPAGNRFNDGKCDRRGRFWAGTMDTKIWDAPAGTLYRLNAEGALAEVLHGIRCSNGLGWSPDNKIFYYVESFAHVIHAFDHDPETGAIGNRRVFAKIDPASGAFPDGLTVDSEGFVWNAQPVYGRLVRYAPDGAMDRIIELPVSRPTSCMFGGGDLATLYVTTAYDSLTPQQRQEEPLAGGLFALRPGVSGIAEVPFAG